MSAIDRCRSTLHNGVQKATESCANPDHVAVDETVIRLTDEQN